MPMLKDIQEALRCREETLVLAGHKLFVRELPSAADLGNPPKDDIFFHLMVACVFLEDGSPAFDAGDIPELKTGSRSRLADLILAVQRVNGLDSAANAEKSEAGQG